MIRYIAGTGPKGGLFNSCANFTDRETLRRCSRITFELGFQAETR